MELILASKSPRRQRIMLDVGYSFSVVDAHFDETSVDLSSPQKGVCDIALGKATTVYKSLPAITKLASVVLGADTIVVCDGEVLGKPKDADDARRMLHQLSGKKHKVYTAVALVNVMDTEVFVESTDVYFHKLTDEEIDAYIKTGEPMDKAGAYAIQGKGSILVDKIDGDYFNVVGLPISKVVRKLRKFKVKMKPQI